MIEQVHPGALADWFTRTAPGASGVLLDVREPWEQQAAPVPADGFELLQMPMREVPARLAELDPARPLACLCHHGVRSQQVAAFLRQRGFERLANVAGGTDAWSDIDDRVTRY